MKTKLKKCPHCNKTYEKEDVTPFVQGWKYGSPLRTCEKCGKQFWDNEYKEISVSGINKEDCKKLSCGTVAFAIILFLLGIFLIWHNESTFVTITGFFFLLSAVFLPIFEVAMYKKRMEKLGKEAEESRKRLSNPQYALMLKMKGFPVPEQYLKNLNFEGVKK